MGSRLPPLRSMEAFVVVGRLLSFSQAAEVLCISQPAVTRRIQALEEDLGYALFHRRANKLALTAAGDAYLADVAPAFDLLHQATANVRTQRGGERVKLRLAQSIAWSWLIPRFRYFNSVHKDIHLQIETATHDGDFAVEDVDLMISFGRREGWPTMRSEILMETVFYPVCHPDLLKTISGPLNVSQLLSLPLISLEQIPQAWEAWSRQQELAGLCPRPACVFDNMQLVMQAAAHGLGVALGSAILCDRYVQSGELVALDAFAANLGGDFHIVGRAEEWETAAIRKVRRWLKQSVSMEPGAPFSLPRHKTA